MIRQWSNRNVLSCVLICSKQWIHLVIFHGFVSLSVFISFPPKTDYFEPSRVHRNP